MVVLSVPDDVILKTKERRETANCIEAEESLRDTYHPASTQLSFWDNAIARILKMSKTLLISNLIPTDGSNTVSLGKGGPLLKAVERPALLLNVSVRVIFGGHEGREAAGPP